MIAALLAISMLCGAMKCAPAGSRPGLSPVAMILAEPAAAAARRPTPVAQDQADPWLASDKLRHFVTAFAVTGYAHAGLRALDVDRDAAVIGGIVISMAAGLGKEIHDVRTGRIFSLKDLVWDLAGALVGGVLARSAR